MHSFFFVNRFRGSQFFADHNFVDQIDKTDDKQTLGGKQMKKLFISIVAVCFALMLAAPTMADTTGYMRVRGLSQGNPGLDKSNQDSDAWFDTRVRLQTVIKPTDKISLTLRADIVDNYKLGGVSATESGGTLIDIDRAYLTIISDFGKFDIGRMSGGAWGTTFGDAENDYDRIKYTLPYSDNLTIVGIIQKNTEGDADNVAGDTINGSDQDKDTYYLAGIYKFENAVAGLLAAYANGREKGTVDVNARALVPYFDAKFGDFGLKGELIYEFGDIDTGDSTTSGDISTLTFNLEATYDVPGPFSFEAGYAYASGNENANNLEAGNATYGGIGEDWDKFVIFSDADMLLNSGKAVSTFGVKLWYVGAKYALTEDITLWGNIGGATADQQKGIQTTQIFGAGTASTSTSDSYGTEYDINMSWNIMDNLTYTARLGFLQAGDLWKTINGVTEVDDTFTIYHKLQVDF
jgi:hypothetical protein